MREWLNLARQGALGSPKTYSDGRILCEEGAPAQSAFFLREGVVQVRHATASGDSIVVKLLVGPSLFGFIEPIAGENLFLEDAVVLGHAVVHEVPQPQIKTLLKGRPDAAYEALVDMAQAFCSAARFEVSKLAATDAALANLFLAYAELFGTEGKDGAWSLSLKRSQSDLAESVGAVERSVNRILARWKSDGWVRKVKGQYVLLDPVSLKQVAGSLSGSLIHRWHDPESIGLAQTPSLVGAGQISAQRR